MTQTRAKDAGTSRLGAAGAAGAAVAVAGALTNGLAYLVPVLGARHLTPGDLSALATVLALVAIAGVAGLGLQMAVAVHRARHPGAPTTRVTLVTTAVTGGTLVAAAPLIVTTLHLSTELVALLAAMTIAVVLTGRWLGELQGDQRFLRLALGMAVLAAGRYGGMIAGLALGAGVVGSLLAGLASGYLALPILAWIARARPDTTPTGETTGGGGIALGVRQVMTTSTATVAMLVVSYADLILARQLLPAAESGAYAVGTVLTKGALWAPQVVTVLALPRLARGDRRTRTTALAVIAASGTALVIASALAGGLAFRLAGGEDYVRLGGHAPVFAAAGALYALVFVLVNDQVAADARWPSAPLWVATGVLTVAALFVVPHTFAGIMWSALAVAAATAVAMCVIVGRRRPRPGPPHDLNAEEPAGQRATRWRS